MRERYHVVLSQGVAELFLTTPLSQEDCDRLLAMVQGVIRLHGPQAEGVDEESRGCVYEAQERVNAAKR